MYYGNILIDIVLSIYWPDVIPGKLYVIMNLVKLHKLIFLKFNLKLMYILLINS